MKRSCVFIFYLLLSADGLGTAHAESYRIGEIKLSLSSAWGKPVSIQYDETTQSGDWRFIRRDATLVITKTPCAECKDPTQAEVEAHYKSKAKPAAAILLNHKGLPALLRLLPEENGENLRVFQLLADGFRYEIRLGVDTEAPSTLTFQLEMEFLQMLNGFTPQKPLSK